MCLLLLKIQYFLPNKTINRFFFSLKFNFLRLYVFKMGLDLFFLFYKKFFIIIYYLNIPVIKILSSHSDFKSVIRYNMILCYIQIIVLKSWYNNT